MANFATKHEGVSMVVVFPRGQLSREDKAKFTKGGIIAVEADDPSKVSILNIGIAPGANVLPSDLFMAALKAVHNGNEGQKFASELFRRMEANEAKEQTP